MVIAPKPESISKQVNVQSLALRRVVSNLCKTTVSVQKNGNKSPMDTKSKNSFDRVPVNKGAVTKKEHLQHPLNLLTV